MENLSFAMFIENASLVWLLESVLNGALILGFIALAMLWIRPKISATTAHLIWLAGLLGMILSPVMSLISPALPRALQGLGEVSLFTVTTPGTAAAGSIALPWADLAMAVYAAVFALVMIRTAQSLVSLQRLQRRARPLHDEEVAAQCERLREALRVGREVGLASTTDAVSPLSFGFSSPTILVPADFCEWDERLREAVLVHELSHIRRLDWVSLLIAHFLCALFWINPMVWFAKRRLDDEAEKACDSAMVLQGRERSDCAESLLELARSRQTALARPLLAQHMVGKSALGQRISYLLEGRLGSRLSRRVLTLLAVPLILLTGLGNQMHLVAAQDNPADQEYLPTYAAAPQYPTRAAEQGVEGWTLFSFTVTPEGGIDPDSIALVDEEPAGYFETTSRRALTQFRFQPRIVAGEAVSVPGVQYLFRFQLEDGGYQNEPERSPPPARR